MRNSINENIQEHSLQVAMIAHALAVIRNTYFGGEINPEKTALLAVYHEAAEVITGDLATPIKYFNPDILKAYREIEDIASDKLLSMLPEELEGTYRPLLFHTEENIEEWKMVKAADKICAYIKCEEELKSGNREFFTALEAIRAEINGLDFSEVKYFMEHFAGSFGLNLDEMN